MGLLFEPIAHPKPGGVSRCRGHGDKDLMLYAKTFLPVVRGCMAACRGECRGFIARGLREYYDLAGKVASTNLNLGSLILLLPVCRASTNRGVVGDVLREASELVAGCDSREDAEAYYDILSSLKISHLGSYEGPLPSVGSGNYPSGLLSVLEHTRWDHVHRELLNGYPLTYEAFKRIVERGVGEESIVEAILFMLADHGDTLIGRKYGWRSYLRAKREAKLALHYARRAGLEAAVSWLDNLWRSRGWNPGSILDIVAVASGLAYAVELGLLVEG